MTNQQNIYLFLYLNFVVIFNISGQSFLHITPDTISITNNNSFEISIDIDSVQNLFGVAFDVVFDTNYIQFEAIEEGNFLNENGAANTIFLFDVQADRVVVAINRTDYTQPGVSTTSDTALVYLMFKSTNCGWTELSFENVGLFDPELNQIPFTIFNGIIDVMGPPEIQNFPDTSFVQGDTLTIHLDDFVNDPDTPDSLLIWEILQAVNISYNINSDERVLSLFSLTWIGNTDIILGVKDPNDFVDIDTFNSVVLMPVNCYEVSVKKELKIKVAPNPFSIEANIEFPLYIKSDQNVEISIYNQVGQIVAHKIFKIYGGEKKFYSFGEEFTNGLYYICINADSYSETFIVIKK